MTLQKLAAALALLAGVIAVAGGGYKYFRDGLFDVRPFAGGVFLLSLAYYFAMQARRSS